ncbi:MAG: acyltransferase [Bacteroidota bacterium]
MRIKGLDFLRGIAIIGVLFRHFEIDFCLSRPGGYGVDLFFVLSGFLVSGLLFSEYKKRGAVNVRRFLIRRGFKIYPSFYFFILCSILIYAIGFENYFPVQSILSEVFFLQSYLHPMWSHTWSLAVEEHFYLLIALFIFLAVKFKWIAKEKVMIPALSAAILLSLFLRIVYVMTVYRESHEPFYFSHLRIDGLFTGALLGYCLHFKPDMIEKIYHKKKILGLLSVVLIVPAFILGTENLFMVTIGFNLLHIAFSFIILLLMDEKVGKIMFGRGAMGMLSAAICTIGIYSYSIYLWHLTMQNLLLRVIDDLNIETVVYVFASIITGVLVSILIEKPMLRLRDRHFIQK